MDVSKYVYLKGKLCPMGQPVVSIVKDGDDSYVHWAQFDIDGTRIADLPELIDTDQLTASRDSHQAKIDGINTLINDVNAS